LATALLDDIQPAAVNAFENVFEHVKLEVEQLQQLDGIVLGYCAFYVVTILFERVRTLQLAPQSLHQSLINPPKTAIAHQHKMAASWRFLFEHGDNLIQCLADFDVVGVTGQRG